MKDGTIKKINNTYLHIDERLPLEIGSFFMADIKFKYATGYAGCTTSKAYIVNIRNLGPNDYIEEEYVYTREEVLTSKIESSKNI